MSLPFKEYLYDVIGRPVSCTGSDGTKISYAFDNFNKSTRTQYYWDGVRKTTAFSYDSTKDNALKTTTFSNGSTLTNTMDGFGRVSIKELSVGSTTFNHVINFTHLSSTRTTNEVARLYYRKGEDEYLSVLDYKYDVNGNITKIYDRPFTSHWPTDSDTPTVSYEYDQLNQLTHEVNGYTGETVDYTYDKRGNILSKTITKDGETNTINYTYGDSNWKDKLTAYDGKTITYDEIGNPLTYDGWTFDWQKGRQLASISNSDTTLSFKYNDSGIRTSKTVNGTETKYLLDGSTIVAQKTGDTILWFYYDGAGKLTAMQNGSNGEYYYYVYNHQGDVVALLDSSLNYVANYTYDSWGKLVSITGSNTAIGNLNPFRYRGYYYDSETGLYYLQSRYYNPEIGRFINADSVIGANGDIISSNLFAYCSNNPVNNHDPLGYGLLEEIIKQLKEYGLESLSVIVAIVSAAFASAELACAGIVLSIVALAVKAVENIKVRQVGEPEIRNYKETYDPLTDTITVTYDEVTHYKDINGDEGEMVWHRKYVKHNICPKGGEHNWTDFAYSASGRPYMMYSYCLKCERTRHIYV